MLNEGAVRSSSSSPPSALRLPALQPAAFIAGGGGQLGWRLRGCGRSAACCRGLAAALVLASSAFSLRLRAFVPGLSRLGRRCCSSPAPSSVSVSAAGALASLQPRRPSSRIPVPPSSPRFKACGRCAPAWQPAPLQPAASILAPSPPAKQPAKPRQRAAGFSLVGFGLPFGLLLLPLPAPSFNSIKL